MIHYNYSELELRVITALTESISSPVNSTTESVEKLYRKRINVPVKFVNDASVGGMIMLAHRKTHKRIKGYVWCWKPAGIKITIKHAPWKDLKG